MVNTASTATHERRRAARVPLHLPLSVRFPEAGATEEAAVAAELLEASVDGCGLALLLAASCHVPVGAVILMQTNAGPAMVGIVVSRLGTQAKLRVGVHVHADSQAHMQSLLLRSGVAAEP